MDPQDVQMEDVGTTATTTTAPRVSAPPVCVTVPSADQVANLMVIRAARGRDKRAEDQWRVIPPQQVPTIIQSPKSGPVATLRRYVYADTKRRLAFMAQALVQRGLPGLEQQQVEGAVIVDRFASENAAWAVYGEIPPTLQNLRRQHAAPKAPHISADDDEPMEEDGAHGGQQQQQQPEAASVPFVWALDGGAGSIPELPYRPPLAMKQREQDARELLEARMGKRTDPLPTNNRALRDMLDGRRTTDPAGVRDQEAGEAVLVLLAKELIGVDPKTGKPKEGTQVMTRARHLATGDGVFLMKQQTVDTDRQVIKAILVRACEVEHMLRAPGETADPFVKDTREKIKAWAETHAATQDRDSGVRRTSLSKANMLTMFAEPCGEGYVCSKREAFYYPENLDPHTRMPPLRVGVPMHREMLLAFLHKHQAAFFGSNMWHLAPDMIMPTCPAMGLLITDVMPYHMSSYAMLNEYTTLMRTAVDRFSTPGMRPPIGLQEGVGGFMSAPDLERASKRFSLDVARAQMCCRTIVAPNNTVQLPDWAGGWFVPNAFCPIPSNKDELEAWYPADDPALHPCVAQLVQMRMESWTARLDAFGALCERMDQVAKESKSASDPDPAVSSGDEQFQAQCLAYLSQQNEPDRSRPGRAETLMGLVVIWVYQCLMRHTALAHHKKIEQLRGEFGSGIDCGNGYVAVRPAAYYDQLWKASIEYTTRLLEIHELILLLLNARWVVGSLARGQLIPSGVRLDPRSVAKAHPETVKRTVDRRAENLRHRIVRDASETEQGSDLSKGPLRIPDTTGERFICGSDKALDPKDDWTSRRILIHAGRPDNPTYAQMILFDHTIDLAGSLGAVDRKEMQRLSQRFRTMVVRANEQNLAHPNWGLQHHMAPGAPSLEGDDKDGRDKRGRSTDAKEKQGGAAAGSKGKRSRLGPG